MKEANTLIKSSVYIDIEDKEASQNFFEIIFNILKRKLPQHNCLIFLCIGTDRATGDSLGPLIGHSLKKSGKLRPIIYGTLESPVHAKNLESTLKIINRTYDNPLIVAIDACLGKLEHVGFIAVGEGSIKPGSGINKNLPAVGHIYITGIVNFSGVMDITLLQNTRLNTVIKMAEIVTTGIKKTLYECSKLCENNII